MSISRSCLHTTRPARVEGSTMGHTILHRAIHAHTSLTHKTRGRSPRPRRTRLDAHTYTSTVVLAQHSTARPPADAPVGGRGRSRHIMGEGGMHPRSNTAYAPRPAQHACTAACSVGCPAPGCIERGGRRLSKAQLRRPCRLLRCPTCAWGVRACAPPRPCPPYR